MAYHVVPGAGTTYAHYLSFAHDENISLWHRRWIEAERVEALLKGTDKSESDIRHVEGAFLSFGAGPRVCPGKVSDFTITSTVTISTSVS